MEVGVGYNHAPATTDFFDTYTNLWMLLDESNVYSA